MGDKARIIPAGRLKKFLMTPAGFLVLADGEYISYRGETERRREKGLSP
jgi:hypothetical protein